MNITIDGDIESGINRYMNQALRYILETEGINGERAEVSLTVTDGEEIRELNREYRGIDQSTDVLSFPQFDSLDELPEDIPILLGDVVINEDRAREQSEEYGHSFEREMVYLFVHSIFHLLGYDHMEDDEKSVMRKREEEIMEKVGLTV